MNFVMSLAAATALNAGYVCTPLEGEGPNQITLDRSDSGLNARFNWKSQDFEVILEALSGSELMGSSGKYLIFFEKIDNVKNRFSIMDTDTVETLVNQVLTCSETEL